MYRGFKIKPFIFAGRKANMEILFPLLHDDIIDTVLIGLNTHDSTDIKYIESYVAEHSKFNIIEVPTAIRRTPSAYRYMFAQMCDMDTIYIKIDDDILRFSDNFWHTLIDFRIDNPNYLLVYPFIINNPYCNYVGGWFKSQFNNPSDCMYWSWSNPLSAALLLSAFLDNKLPLSHLYTMKPVEINNEQTWWRSEIHDYVRPSINVICFNGKDCMEMNWPSHMAKSRSDEVFLTHDIFSNKISSRKNCIVPQTYCVHYSFYPQKTTLNKLGLLSRFRQDIS